MKNINWKVRFSKENIQFIVRFIAALVVPILAYMGFQFEDITSWAMLWQLTLDFLGNPFLVGLTIYNAINIVPDPTTAGINDSDLALSYTKPKKKK